MEMQERVQEEGRERPEAEACLAVEEIEEAVYSQLQVPTEDIYARPDNLPSAEHRQADAKTSDDAKTNLSGGPDILTVELKEKTDLQTPGNVRLYRGACFLLTLICLVLLLVIIILCVKLPAERLVCPEKEAPALVKEEDRLQCSVQSCTAQYPQLTRPNCVPIPPCAPGWQLFEDSCYFLSTVRLSWEESRQDCRTRGGDLATVTNDRVQNFLIQKGGLIYWVGLRFIAEKWTWVNNNALEKSFRTGALSGGDCCTLVGRQQPELSWQASPCDYSSAYICQSPAQRTTPAALG